jgi:hypothetical protein
MKEIYKAVDKEIRSEAREEAKEILKLTTDALHHDFLEFYKKDQGNLCCMILDEAKRQLIAEGKMVLNKDDNFGHPIIEVVEDAPMKRANAAQVLQGYLWREGNLFPVEKVKLEDGQIKITHDVQLEFLMKFQDWLFENQKKL